MWSALARPAALPEPAPAVAMARLAATLRSAGPRLRSTRPMAVAAGLVDQAELRRAAEAGQDLLARAGTPPRAPEELRGLTEAWPLPVQFPITTPGSVAVLGAVTQMRERLEETGAFQSSAERAAAVAAGKRLPLHITLAAMAGSVLPALEAREGSAYWPEQAPVLMAQMVSTENLAYAARVAAVVVLVQPHLEPAVMVDSRAAVAAAGLLR